MCLALHYPATHHLHSIKFLVLRIIHIAQISASTRAHLCKFSMVAVNNLLKKKRTKLQKAKKEERDLKKTPVITVKRRHITTNGHRLFSGRSVILQVVVEIYF